MDEESMSILIDFGDFSVLVSLEPDGRTINFEATLIFDGDLGNMKTLSSLAHTAYYHRFGISGLSNKASSQVKLYLGRDLDYSSIHKLGEVLEASYQCLDTMVRYLYYRSLQTDSAALDLSMFEDVNLFLFDPQAMGEKKDFHFGDWSKYADSVSSGETEVVVDPEIVIEEIQACAEFENKNNMLLSEVGDRILEEIIWHRQMRELAKSDKYSVN
jgi:hypothetical protein